MKQLLARRQPGGQKRHRVAFGRRAENELAAQLDGAGLAGRYEREYRFLPDRRFRLDFAFVHEMIAVEIDGQVHAIKGRREGDVKRGQIALTHGWTLLHVLPAQVRTGEALELVLRIVPPHSVRSRPVSL